MLYVAISITRLFYFVLYKMRSEIIGPFLTKPYYV